MLESVHDDAVVKPAAEMIARTSALVSTSPFRASISAAVHVCPKPAQWVVQLVCTAAIDHAAFAVGMASSSSTTMGGSANFGQEVRPWLEAGSTCLKKTIAARNPDTEFDTGAAALKRTVRLATSSRPLVLSRRSFCCDDGRIRPRSLSNSAKFASGGGEGGKGDSCDAGDNVEGADRVGDGGGGGSLHPPCITPLTHAYHERERAKYERAVKRRFQSRYRYVRSAAKSPRCATAMCQHHLAG